mmetsp:Transcript_1518/g.2767  ORF Transcript_1518/g.2767 Transcript_1518/m.2767 type:complete len:207 (-) Transcript_1518:797-1417(-)
MHFSNRNGLLCFSSSAFFVSLLLPSGFSSTKASICDRPAPPWAALRFLLASRSVKSSMGIVTYLSKEDSNSSETMLTTAVWLAGGIAKILVWRLSDEESPGVVTPPVDDAGDAESCVRLLFDTDFGNSATSELYTSIRTTDWCCVKHLRKQPFISYRMELQVLALPVEEATVATPSKVTRSLAAHFRFSTSAEKSDFLASKNAWST